jgi:hypothetical protein
LIAVQQDNAEESPGDFPGISSRHVESGFLIVFFDRINPSDVDFALKPHCHLL